MKINLKPILKEDSASSGRNVAQLNSALDKLIQTIPTIQISEKWGDPKSVERVEFDNQLKAFIKGGQPIDRLKSFISNVNGLAKKSSPTASFNNIFNRLILMRTINNIVTGFSPSGAGFIFEALTAAIMGGQQEVGKNEAGVLANADVTVAGQSFSMKLLSGKESRLKGSKVGLAAGVKQYGKVTYIIMLRPSTTGGTVTFYSGEVDPTNLFAKDAKGTTMGFIQNGSWKQYTSGKWKLDEDPQFKFLPSEKNLSRYFNNVTNLGTLDVETDTIRNIVRESLVDLQEKIEPIYSALKEFTLNLHQYFSAEKEDKRKVYATQAKNASRKLDASTQQTII